MIDPKSLRKGNWVLYYGQRRFIEEIGKFGIDLYGDFDGQVHADISFEELEGIDLSPEILLEFGFEEVPGHIDDVGEGLQLQRYHYRKTIVKNEVPYKLECLSTGGWEYQGVKLLADPWHVHELQNLFYFLMNEELGLTKFE
jgi:hypothetical protein